MGAIQNNSTIGSSPDLFSVREGLAGETSPQRGQEGDQQSWSQCQRVVFPEASEVESHAKDEATSLLNHFKKL